MGAAGTADDPAAIRALYRLAVPSGLRELHVDALAGDDAADGSSPQRATATISAACALARAGDRILVAPGRYGRVDAWGLEGAPEAWISIEALDVDDPPVVDVAAAPTNGIDLQQSRYVGLHGLVVVGDPEGPSPDASGIAVFRGCSFVRIWCCTVRDFPGGGINCFWTPEVDLDGRTLPAGGWDCVDVAFDDVSGCCRFSTYNTSGISFFGAEDLVPGTLEGGYGYRAVGNRVEDCRCLVPYLPGGIPFVTDGNGISIDSLQVRNALAPDLPPYSKRGLVEGNLVAGNGGRGLHVYNSTGVLDCFNTYARNLQSDSPAFTDAAETECTPHGGTWDVEHYGNVVAPGAGRRAIAGGRSEADLILVASTAVDGPSGPPEEPPVPRATATRHRGALGFRLGAVLTDGAATSRTTGAGAAP